MTIDLSNINSASVRDLAREMDACSCVYVDTQNGIDKYLVDAWDVYVDNAGGLGSEAAEDDRYYALRDAYMA